MGPSGMGLVSAVVWMRVPKVLCVFKGWSPEWCYLQAEKPLWQVFRSLGHALEGKCETLVFPGL
jgi:hypothetical protein